MKLRHDRRLEIRLRRSALKRWSRRFFCRGSPQEEEEEEEEAEQQQQQRRRQQDE